MTRAHGRVALRQTQRWQAPSSSVDLPASAPGGHERCSSMGLRVLTFPSMVCIFLPTPAGSRGGGGGVGAECTQPMEGGGGVESK